MSRGLSRYYKKDEPHADSRVGNKLDELPSIKPGVYKLLSQEAKPVAVHIKLCCH